MITEVTTLDQLRDAQEGIVLVDFYSDNCVFCEKLAPVLEQVAFELPFVSIVKVNCSRAEGVSDENEVFAFPTLKVFRDGEELDSITGFRPADAVRGFIAEYLY